MKLDELSEAKIDSRSFDERFEELREAVLEIACEDDKSVAADRLLLALKADVEEHVGRLDAELRAAEDRIAETEPPRSPLGDAFDEVIDCLGDPKTARDRLDRLKRRVLLSRKVALEALERADRVDRGR